MMDGTTASYTTMILRGEQPQPRVVAAVDKDDDNDNGPVSGLNSLSSVELAHTAGTVCFISSPLVMLHHQFNNVISA
jgi:hypothetical protein